MPALGAMVEAGMAPESIDRMDITDLYGWYEVMKAYRAEVVKNRPKPPRG